MSHLHLFTLGAISKPIAVQDVWVTSPSAVVTAKREYAERHGLRESRVWAERRKSPQGFVTKEVADE